MVVVALVLVAACAVVVLGALLGDASAEVALSFFGAVDVDVTSTGAFLVGLGTGAVSLLALWLLVAALRRARHKAAERHAMERRHDELEREKADLEHKLGRDREPDLGPPAEPGSRDTYGLSSQPRDDGR